MCLCVLFPAPLLAAPPRPCPVSCWRSAQCPIADSAGCLLCRRSRSNGSPGGPPPLPSSAPGYHRSLTHKPGQRSVLQGRSHWVMMSPSRVKSLNMSKKHMSTSSQSPSPGSACRYEVIWPRCAWQSSPGEPSGSDVRRSALILLWRQTHCVLCDRD